MYCSCQVGQLINQLVCLFHGSISVGWLFAGQMVEHMFMPKSLTIITMVLNYNLIQLEMKWS